MLLPAAAPQPLELVEQIERESGSGKVDAEILLEPHDALHAHQRDAGKAPLPALRTARLDDAFGNDLDDELLAHAAQRTQLVETHVDRIVEQHCADGVGHDAPSMLARGFSGCAAASCR